MGTPAALIQQNIAEVQARIAEAAQRSGRSADAVRLVAITKTHGLDAIEAACQAGLRHFGENRVEEAQDKIRAARQVLPPDVVWHMVGHIQSRKSPDVPPLFDWVHSIDREKIARRLSAAAVSAGRTLDVLIEVNVSGEESKHGFDLSRWPGDPAQGEVFFAAVGGLLTLPGLRWQGLMMMAPFVDDAETLRPLFRRARELRAALCERFPAPGWPHLSMGMSGDYEVAIEEGATMVRVGTALFGPRAL